MLVCDTLIKSQQHPVFNVYTAMGRISNKQRAEKVLMIYILG